MDFQMVFGNPRKKKRGKKVAKRRRKKKVSRKAKKAKKKVSEKVRRHKKSKRKAAKKASHKKTSRKSSRKSKKRRSSKKRRNPSFLRATKGKSKVDSRIHYTKAETDRARGLVEAAKQKYRAIPIGERTPGLVKQMLKVRKLENKLNKKSLTPEEQKYLADFAKKWSDKGYKVDRIEYPLGSKKPGGKRKSKKSKKGGSSMAKRRRKKSKARKSKARKSRRKAKKTAVHASVHVGKKTTSSKLKAKKRLKKGQTVSKSVKRGRKKYRASLKRTNPISGGRDVSSFVPALRGTALGTVNLKAIGYYGAASALSGVLDASLLKVPGVGAVYGNFKAMLSKAPFLAGAAPALGVSSILTVAEILAQKSAPGKYPAQLKDFNEALATVGLIHVAAGIGQMVVKMIPGMSGVVYTPELSGVQLWPNRAQRQFDGVVYTPELAGTPPQMGHGQYPQMGYGADFGQYAAADYGGGDGYTESHPRSNADFGGADFGPEMAGYAPQMGVVPQVMSGDEEPVLDQSMGSMG